MRVLTFLTVALGLLFSVTLAASVARADAVQVNEYIHQSPAEQRSAAEHRAFDLPDISRAEEHAYLFLAVHSDNGKHLGFTAASVHRGPRFGLVKPTAPTVTQNPEPATLVLLATGLATVGGILRRRRKA